MFLYWAIKYCQNVSVTCSVVWIQCDLHQNPNDASCKSRKTYPKIHNLCYACFFITRGKWLSAFLQWETHPLH